MPLSSASVPIPRNYFLVLYPAHQLLDSAGPLDILSTITKQTSVPNTDITLTVLSDTLSPIPLPPVPPQGAEWEFEEVPELKGASAGRVPGSGFDLPITPHVTFEQALKHLRETGEVEVKTAGGVSERRRIDVLLIPGGIGSRINRVNKKTGKKSLNVAAAVDFVRETCEKDWIRSAILTVCTGSDLLARTGVLNGRRATTNWNAFDMVSGRHKDVEWLKGRRWVRSLPKAPFEKEIWTSAGISAGMDLTLWFTAELYGMDFAHGIARRLEYQWRDQIGEGEVDPYYQ